MFIVLPLDDGSNGPINPPTYPPLYLGSSRPRWFNIIEIIHWTATGSKCKCILSKSQFISINSKIIIVINRNRRHRGCCQAKAVCCDPVNERSFDHRTVMHFAIMYTRTAQLHHVLRRPLAWDDGLYGGAGLTIGIERMPPSPSHRVVRSFQEAKRSP